MSNRRNPIRYGGVTARSPYLAGYLKKHGGFREDAPWLEIDLPLNHPSIRYVGTGEVVLKSDKRRFASIVRWIAEEHGGKFINAMRASPIVLMQAADNDLYLMDGNHRLRVARNRRERFIPAIVVVMPGATPKKFLSLETR